MMSIDATAIPVELRVNFYEAHARMQQLSTHPKYSSLSEPLQATANTLAAFIKVEQNNEFIDQLCLLNNNTPTQPLDLNRISSRIMQCAIPEKWSMLSVLCSGDKAEELLTQMISDYETKQPSLPEFISQAEDKIQSITSSSSHDKPALLSNTEPVSKSVNQPSIEASAVQWVVKIVQHAEKPS